MSSNPPAATPRRILVLGSTQHPKSVTCYNWHELPGDLNVADYDIVILNLMPLLDSDYSDAINRSSLPDFPQFMRQIFGSNGEITAIGVLDLNLVKYGYLGSDWWLPFDIKATFEKGEAVSLIDNNFSFYFKHVTSWQFHLDSGLWPISKESSTVTSDIDPRANRLWIHKQDIAVTRFGLAIAFELKFELTKAIGSLLPTHEQIAMSGTVTWLPPTTSIGHVEAVNLLLRHKYGLLFEKPVPTWIFKYKLPRQIPLEQQIDNTHKEIQRLQSELHTAMATLNRESRYLGMLYEQGEDILEPLVRDALRELGAVVTDPVDKGKADGRLVDPFGREAVLEIKGRTGSLQLKDVRQLDQWVRDVLFDEGKPAKGLLLCNLNLELPLEERGEGFHSSCIQGAERGNHALITTSQLLRALQDHHLGVLDQKAFWDNVFNTVGLSKLPQIEEYKA